MVFFYFVVLVLFSEIVVMCVFVCVLCEMMNWLWMGKVLV